MIDSRLRDIEQQPIDQAGREGSTSSHPPSIFAVGFRVVTHDQKRLLQKRFGVGRYSFKLK